MRGLYVHIPFCKSKCPYCHFYSETSFSISYMEDYFEACLKDLADAENKSFDTIYFGGGTPSAIPAKILANFTENLINIINFSHEEFTIEANPESVSEDFISFIRNFPVTRISLGVQSFDDNVLKLLGRIHSSTKAFQACEELKKTGLNLNIDMIFDIPGISENHIMDTANKIINIDPSHVSAYSYSAEDRNYLTGFDSDETLFFQIEKLFTEKGFMKYETSNFAKSGKKSLHNQIYWNGEEYIGIGASSHSMIYDENGYRIRYSRPSDIKTYLKSHTSYEIHEKLSKSDAAKETIITALRTSVGADFDDIEKRFGKIDKNLIDNINAFVEKEMLRWDAKFLKTTSKGAALLDLLSSHLW